MSELASSGLNADQIALVMELSAALGAEAAPQKSRKAINQAAYRERQRSATNGNDVAPLNDIYSKPPPSPEPKGSSDGKRKRVQPTFELPSIIPAELWAEFEAMRVRKKKPLTDFGRKQLVGKLVNIAEAGWNIEDVMAKAIVGCHDGFWMPDGRDSNIRRANEPRAGPVNLDEYRERLARIGKSDG
jgi:hypothetical protein